MNGLCTSTLAVLLTAFSAGGQVRPFTTRAGRLLAGVGGVA